MKTVEQEISFDLAHGIDSDNSIQEDFISKQLRISKYNYESTPSKTRGHSAFSSSGSLSTIN